MVFKTYFIKNLPPQKNPVKHFLFKPTTFKP